MARSSVPPLEMDLTISKGGTLLNYRCPLQRRMDCQNDKIQWVC